MTSTTLPYSSSHRDQQVSFIPPSHAMEELPFETSAMGFFSSLAGVSPPRATWRKFELLHESIKNLKVLFWNAFNVVWKGIDNRYSLNWLDSEINCSQVLWQSWCTFRRYCLFHFRRLIIAEIWNMWRSSWKYLLTLFRLSLSRSRGRLTMKSYRLTISC